MLILKCVSCGQRHEPLTLKLWGRTRESSGYGPLPRCTALVDGDGPKAPDGSTPQQFCGGMLGATDEPLKLAVAPDGVTIMRDIGTDQPLYDNADGFPVTFAPLTPL